MIDNTTQDTKGLSIKDGWIKPARRCPSPNQNKRPQDEISLLVIHNISLPPGQFGEGYIEDLFQNCLDRDVHPYFEDIADLEVSSHLLIDRQGEIIQFVGFDQRAWHAGVSCYKGREQCNDFSVGIELEGTDDTTYTDQQYRVLVNTCRQLINTYPELTEERIVGHCDIAPGRKTDPGPSFDWQRFKLMLSDTCK
ncbi:MAG: 1,6-anhydro-N-acetylmuramyl-L-alanine amidase AmpD [Motiliproteus sp.]|nr:1,6-anhydro-N-acetylmuramyl-L-alanine amidase AmpD [Motiliproteus sp.]MCW9052252.1 1,6-anhydro-N-acetylmuramyl-L-alanine amidase AmpD [Motiliproteus sp.]